MMGDPNELLAAIHAHLLFQRHLGDQHPRTYSAKLKALFLAPVEIQEEICENNPDALLPAACGYLEDGSPVYSLVDIVVGLTEAAGGPDATAESIEGAFRELFNRMPFREARLNQMHWPQ
jgi:hypothetical protein